MTKAVNQEIQKIFTAATKGGPRLLANSSPGLTTMGKAKKTRKFAATKRLLNTTKDTRIQSINLKTQKTQEKKKESNGELVREMYLP